MAKTWPQEATVRYVWGHLKAPKAKEIEITKAQKLFAAGSIHQLQQVALLREQASFISAPIKSVIDLQKTRVTQVEKDKSMWPCFGPSTSVAEVLQVGSRQRCSVYFSLVFLGLFASSLIAMFE